MAAPIRVTVFGENYHEQHDESVQKLYPNGLHGAIAEGLNELLGEGVEVRTVVMDEPEHGLTEEVLANTDVLTWWGHWIHQHVDDAVVDRVHQAVLDGMGLIVLHSGHHSKIFRKLMGTTCNLRWRGGENRELIWTVNPTHPIAQGVPSPMILPSHEMYGEFFDIPTPDDLIFVSSFDGGEVFRGGCTFRRGHGKIFYFSPGDQEYPIYFDPDIRRVIANGVQWVHSERAERGAPPVIWKRIKGYGPDRDTAADLAEAVARAEEYGMEIIKTTANQVTAKGAGGFTTTIEV
ncbi:ThuA domain-containing protein [Aestuariimicrobium ganziense]|uniref:ThuA domain-containing protein n=1 Tax=Aestuariimicrobium ganziense TaxID=2773677 RepID=UPI00194168AB|nr:ThuA domain-containing protein [Aestuariimicrobium ganziense]